MIRVRGLKKSFGEKQILKGINLEVPTGETIVIIGPSGSGKSTVLRCINRLEHPEEGKLLIGAREYDLAHATKKEILSIRKQMAMVFQNFSLFENKTALDNIKLPLVKAKGYSDKEATKIALSYLDEVGLTEWKNHYPIQLSGGQAQRIGIARALALKPEVILFDEPTSALDPERVQGVLELIKKVSAERITSVIVTHELKFALEVADNVIFMEDGVIVERGDAKEVLLNPKEERTVRFLGHFADKMEYVI